MTWTKEDSAQSIAQGWNVFEIWDGRVEFEIQKDDPSNIFISDEAARSYVRIRAAAGDALALKATQIVFRSKVGAAAPGKTKRKKS
jgi:hypothetical protein